VGNLKLEYIEKYSNKNIFIESGTHLGDTIEIMKPHFKRLHSIELNKELYDNAVKRFEYDDNVIIWYGDSPDIIPTILKNVSVEATFWLDGHASGPLAGGQYGGCPLPYELKAIKNHAINSHTIFIDDVRLFGCAEWSFVQKDQVLNILKEINPNYTIKYLDGYINNDILLAYIED
jgi:hypothetical protein